MEVKSAIPSISNSIFVSYFMNKYSNSNTSQEQKDYVIKNYNRDYYDHLSNFYLNNTTDVNKTFKKYKHFNHIKVITRQDIYNLFSNDNCNNKTNDDIQVTLLGYYNQGLIPKNEFLSNFSQPSIFLSSCIPWHEFLSLFTIKNNSNNKSRTIGELDSLLDTLNSSIIKKSFDFKEYHDLNKSTKIGIIMNFFFPFKH